MVVKCYGSIKKLKSLFFPWYWNLTLHKTFYLITGYHVIYSYFDRKLYCMLNSQRYIKLTISYWSTSFVFYILLKALEKMFEVAINERHLSYWLPSLYIICLATTHYKVLLTFSNISRCLSIERSDSVKRYSITSLHYSLLLHDILSVVKENPFSTKSLL